MNARPRWNVHPYLFGLLLLGSLVLYVGVAALVFGR